MLMTSMIICYKTFWRAGPGIGATENAVITVHCNVLQHSTAAGVDQLSADGRLALALVPKLQVKKKKFHSIGIATNCVILQKNKFGTISLS